MSHSALVERLAIFINPWAALRVRPLWQAKRIVLPVAAYRPDPGFLEDDTGRWRTSRYHRGRIVHFAELLAAGEDLEPVDIDNVCSGNYIAPVPLMLDGHHRFTAAILANKPTLPMNYGGRCDLLRWLTGKSDRLPRE